VNKTIIIAEAGVNHNGEIKIAKKLIDIASEAGVDYVKFQTFKADNLVSTTAKKADYQKKNTKKNDETQFQMLKKLELSEKDHLDLIEYCNGRSVKFFSTAFDLESLIFLKKIGLELVKIPSGEITNLPYLRLAAKLFKKVIISTGMANLKEIENCMNVFLNEGVLKTNISILHCNTEYPTKMEEVNLKAMNNIYDQFNVSIGYSDHTLGIEVPIAAVALGASVIEKHFTLDRNMKGPDHKASLEPNELISMVKSIRNIEKAISGSGVKEPSKSESKNIKIARKSIFLNSDIYKNQSIKANDLIMKRPGHGISPMKFDKIIGKKAVQDLKKGDLLDWKNIKL
tara:strand:+ start:1645 stop:2670 length:1026 start_codon:yes stop_codon:yes gene_type:complete